MTHRRYGYRDWKLGETVLEPASTGAQTIIPHVALDDGTGAIQGSTANPLIVTATSTLATGTYTNKSGSMTAGGTAQTLMAANTSRKRYFIQNPATIAGQNIGAVESLFINYTTDAGINDGASIELQPGESFDSGGGPVTTEKITVNATTILHRYIAKEM